METKDATSSEGEVDFFIDITADVCPITFVRTKLLIERMASGQTAEVRLRGAEPLSNVPRAIAMQGHRVISLKAEADLRSDLDQSADKHGPHRLRLRKS